MEQTQLPGPGAGVMLYIFAVILGLMGGFALNDAMHLGGPASEASALAGVLEICAGLLLSAIAFIAQKARQLVYLAHRRDARYRAMDEKPVAARPASKLTYEPLIETT